LVPVELAAKKSPIQHEPSCGPAVVLSRGRRVEVHPDFDSSTFERSDAGWMNRTPDHVTISRSRRLMAEATHQEVFGWVLRQVARAGFLKGKAIGIDATTLEANAAMKSIVRRDRGELHRVSLYQESARTRGHECSPQIKSKLNHASSEQE